MMPSKWHWKRSSDKHVANAISATDLAGTTGNQTEDERVNMFMKLQSWLPLRSLIFRKRDWTEWTRETWDQMGTSRVDKVQKHCLWAHLHRPVCQLWFCFSCGLNRPGGRGSSEEQQCRCVPKLQRAWYSPVPLAEPHWVLEAAAGGPFDTSHVKL